MLTATQHQRVDRYLAELAGALGALPASERDDVVAGVREHVEAALTGRSPVTDADIDEVLRALGDPLAIAAEATGDDGSGGSPGGPGAAGPAAQPRKVPFTSRDSTPTLVVLLLGAAPLVLGFFFGLFLLPFALIAGWVLLWLSPLWTTGEKLAGTFLLPALGLVFFSFTFFVSGGTEVCVSDGPSDGPAPEPTCTTSSDAILSPLGAWIVIGVLAVAAVATAVVLLRNGQRRAAELAQSFSTGA